MTHRFAGPVPPACPGAKTNDAVRTRIARAWSSADELICSSIMLLRENLSERMRRPARDAGAHAEDAALDGQEYRRSRSPEAAARFAGVSPSLFGSITVGADDLATGWC